MTDKIKQEYLRWVAHTTDNKEIADELRDIKEQENRIEDAFYRNLEFGTGGLRGILGAGTNRMNVYTVRKASQGLADYVKKHFAEGSRSIAVSYDSRINSKLFALEAAGVFAANGIEVFLYKELMPTPCLSFAVRKLKCSAGIMITASHNPAQYNGYKVYGADGCQITVEAAAEILAEIEKLDIFSDVKYTAYEIMTADGEENIHKVQTAVNESKQNAVSEKPQENKYQADKWIHFISEAVYDNFIEAVKSQSVLYGDAIDRNVSIVYTPLNGTGLKPVLRALKEGGFTNVTVVAEQEQPDGSFPTCHYPNPEIKEAMVPGMRCAEEHQADLLLATDPDCDRVGIAVRNHAEEYILLSGDEVGMLLLHYICSQRTKHGKMPADPVMVKTIVSIDMAERIAVTYGVRTINVLTGFKFIGEQISRLEALGKMDSYIFGFEDSYGYLSGSYVRDKDAVGGTYLICEMFAYYKTRGISLLDKLEELYQQYGYCLNTLHSFTFEGAAGFRKMQQIMALFRKGLTQIGPKKVIKMLDYSEGLDGLPRANVLKFVLEGDSSVVVRPSGTEPKLKTYLSVSAEDKKQAERIEEEISSALKEYFI